VAFISFFKLLCRSSTLMLSLVADVSNKKSPLEGLKVLVVGAGGAGRALAFGAQQKGAQVLIANRTDGEEEDCGGIGRLSLKTLISFSSDRNDQAALSPQQQYSC
jgi:D-arabinose 1-dehydrogenase-like Zn-dependent alcohol dehydrogenase